MPTHTLPYSNAARYRPCDCMSQWELFSAHSRLLVCCVCGYHYSALYNKANLKKVIPGPKGEGPKWFPRFPYPLLALKGQTEQMSPPCYWPLLSPSTNQKADRRRAPRCFSCVAFSHFFDWLVNLFHHQRPLAPADTMNNELPLASPPHPVPQAPSGNNTTSEWKATQEPAVEEPG